MHIFFADDSAHGRPSRKGMGSLVATGGLLVDADNLASLEKSIEFACTRAGFPSGEEFKWSPRANAWMRKSLVDDTRRDFFLAVAQTCKDHDATATVIVSDETSRTPLSCTTHQEFVTKMLIERVNWLARAKQSTALIVSDRPGGNATTDRIFLAQCLEAIQKGTGYVTPKHIAINAVSTDSKLIRLLQAADLFVSCVTAFVAGESTFSPPIFAAIRPLLASQAGRAGGIGLKLHPDFSFVNLYHWLLGDSHFWRGNTGFPLPFKNRMYAKDPSVPWGG
jgi:hypothetical protein